MQLLILFDQLHVGVGVMQFEMSNTYGNICSYIMKQITCQMLSL